MKRTFICLALCLSLTQLHGAATTTISNLPQLRNPSTNTYFEISDMSATPKSRKLWLLDLKRYFLDSTANTLTKWTGTNSVGSVPNGEGVLVNDGAGNFAWTTNFGSIFQTISFFETFVTNMVFLSGKGNTAIFTNNVLFPFKTLTLSGTNASQMNLTNTAFKITLTTNAFVGTPTGFPGTNLLYSGQLHVLQDNAGGWGLTLTNGSFTANGAGTSTNWVPSITTNAGGWSVITFSSSPFTAGKLASISTPLGP